MMNQRKFSVNLYFQRTSQRFSRKVNRIQYGDGQQFVEVEDRSQEKSSGFI